MEKLLIVDDEEWIVEGLKCQLDWMNLGIEIIGVAANGEEAIVKLEELKPDILLTDIRMPKLDGLELAKYIYGHKIDCEIIIISGYADFSYAKKAIEYQVTAYLTKPIEREDLEESIKSAIERIKQKRRDKREKNLRELDEYNMELSERYLSEETARENTKTTGDDQKNYITVLFHVFYLENKKDTKEDYSTQFQRIVKSSQRNENHGIFFQNHSNRKQYALILDYDKTINKEEAFKTLLHDLEIMTERVKEEMKIEAIIGISEPYENTEQSFKGYLQAKFIVENTKKGNGILIITKDQFDNNYLKVKVNREKISELLFAIEFSNRKQTKELYQKIVEECLKEKNQLIQLRMSIQEILIYLSNLLLKYESNMYKVSNEYADIFNRFWEIESTELLVEECFVIIEDVQDYIEATRNTGRESTVSQIKKYIDEHYTEPISLNSMASKYYMNGAYLSRVFKKEIGVNFNDYIKKVRLEKAAKLLRTRNMKMYEIAEQVGYDNVNYFLKKFREEYGVTPSQYRE